jgi:adenine deaminase
VSLEDLIAVARGDTPGDLLLANARVVNTLTGESEETDVVVFAGRVAGLGSGYQARERVDLKGNYLLPSFIDGHTHIESSMLWVDEYARAVVPHGTAAVVTDLHEIANVCGLFGMEQVVRAAAALPFELYLMAASCVPATPLETSGASLGPRDIEKALALPGVIGLGEMMNFPGVLKGDAQMHAEMAEAHAAGGVVGGHYASPDLGLPFHGYVAGGAEDDHEGTRLTDAVARVRQGMKAMLRLGSAWHDVEAQIKAVTELGLDPRHFILVTDDSHSGTLVHEGHMDRVVRHAVEQGVPPVVAVQMATLNTAEHFGMAREVGQIAPGRFADILLVSDLSTLSIDMVIAKGRVAVRDGQLDIDVPPYRYPDQAMHSVRLARPLAPTDFEVLSRGDGRVTVNVIGVVENQAPTRHLRMSLEAVDGRLPVDLTQDIAKVALVERHRGTGKVQVGFVHGFGFDAPCAVASTVAHDSQHMLLVGTEERSMAVAGNELARVGGGQVVVRGGKVLALVELPIAGLMSSERAEVVAAKAKKVLEAFRSCGCRLNNANMQLSLLALAVIPALRISDKGLVDVHRFKVIPVVSDQG